jgi:hypothetical protein
VTEGDGDVGPIAPVDDIVLDTAEITLGADRSITDALQRSARAVAAGDRRRNRRVGPRCGRSDVGSLPGAADPAFDGRPIAARRALAAADRHWAMLAVWALVDPVVRWSVPLLEHGGIDREPPATAGPTPRSARRSRASGHPRADPDPAVDRLGRAPPVDAAPGLRPVPLMTPLPRTRVVKMPAHRATVIGKLVPPAAVPPHSVADGMRPVVPGRVARRTRCSPATAVMRLSPPGTAGTIRRYTRSGFSFVNLAGTRRRSRRWPTRG